jgi:hypothetical protein
VLVVDVGGTSIKMVGDVLAGSARFGLLVRRKPVRFASTVSTRSLERSGFGSDDAHQVVPGFDERFGAFFLKVVRQYVDVNPFSSVLLRARLPLATYTAVEPALLRSLDWLPMAPPSESK